ncbi:hypothetical protein [Arthrobacter sp. SLBN-112]|uniref:hypothetical protein n=1 Tax=Arthrobacter sp. SLBN-112 TaxID=2768452 RepID=UPI00114D8820|nr:hypothetical protein [Arthrobacter sp. SLBN-112]
MSKEIYQARAEVAVRVRNGQPVEEARRRLAAAKLEQYISKVVAEAPPLSKEQVDRIALLLRPSDGQNGLH